VTKIKSRTSRHRALKKLLGAALVVMLIALWFSSSTTRPFLGKPLGPDAWQQADHSKDRRSNDRSSELLVLLGFSGGGTRAAALSYAVLQELAATTITIDGRKRRLSDEIDVISSVSGGSFTSAYFGLFGDGIFDDFKQNVLLRPIQDDLLKGLFNPGNWRDLSSPYYGRSDLTAAYYDEEIFQGKTFADIDRSSAPWIIINSSDIGTGQRMVFTRHLLNLLCVDYDSYPVARAVAASAGVPGAETPILFKNYAGSCGYKLPDWLLKPLQAEKNPVWAAKIQSYLDYLDAAKRPWLHLVDGGITDNLGLREYYEFSSLDRKFEQLLRKLAGDEVATVTDVLIISVNAAVEHHLDWANLPGTPTEGEALGSMTHIQMRNFTEDTLQIVQNAYQRWQDEAAQGGAPANFEFIEIAFSEVADKEEKAYLNTLPTSLQLDQEQVDTVIETGRRLLRESPSFQQFLARHQLSRKLVH
jgi:NTE family protein